MIDKINLKKINKVLIVSILLLFVLNITITSAATSIGQQISGGADAATKEAYGDVKQQALTTPLIFIINSLLTFIAILFLLGLIYAGYLWMTAKGNQEQIDKAKKITREIVIGLIIIFLSRILTEFILTQIGKTI
jgi:cytochrome bd-type quinol oxidase subunit 2